MMVFGRLASSGLCSAILAASVLTASACKDEVPVYQKKAAPSGRAADIPAAPTLPTKKKKDEGSYTIYGVVHDLHSKVHAEEVSGKELSLVGYIVRTNLVECKDDSKAVADDCVPKCAIHKQGKETPADCKAPIPAFWIADSKDEKTEMVKVMGWASNFAAIVSAIEEYDKAPNLEKLAEIKFGDSFGHTLPNPLPAVGAKVVVKGMYGPTYTGASTGMEVNGQYGIMGMQTLEYKEPAPELANLPTLKPRKKLTK